MNRIPKRLFSFRHTEDEKQQQPEMCLSGFEILEAFGVSFVVFHTRHGVKKKFLLLYYVYEHLGVFMVYCNFYALSLKNWKLCYLLILK